MRFLIPILVLMVADGLGDDGKAKQDLGRLQGDWSVVSCFVGSQELTSPDGPHRLSFEGDQMANVRNGQQPQKRSTVTLDPTNAPAQIDIDGGGVTLKGIYKIDGKRLRICYNKETRPTRFDAQEQANEPPNVLYELKRE